jgi:hypothetical protein
VPAHLDQVEYFHVRSMRMSERAQEAECRGVSTYRGRYPRALLQTCTRRWIQVCTFLRGVQSFCNTSGILPSGPQLYHMAFVNHPDFRKDANKLTLIGMWRFEYLTCTESKFQVSDPYDAVSFCTQGCSIVYPAPLEYSVT